MRTGPDASELGEGPVFDGGAIALLPAAEALLEPLSAKALEGPFADFFESVRLGSVRRDRVVLDEADELGSELGLVDAAQQHREVPQRRQLVRRGGKPLPVPDGCVEGADGGANIARPCPQRA